MRVQVTWVMVICWMGVATAARAEISTEAWGHNEMGLEYYNKGEWERAITEFSKALALLPEEAVILSNRGLAYRAANKLDQAIDDFTKSIDALPKSPGVTVDPWASRGRCYYRKKEYKLAVADFDHSLSLHRTDGNLLVWRGYCHLALRDYAKAEADFTQALRYSGDKRSVLRARAELYADQEKYAEAVKDLSAVLQGNPKDVDVWLDRSAVFDQWGQRAYAVLDIYRAMAAKPDDHRAPNLLNAFYAKLSLPPPPKASEDPFCPREGEIRLEGTVVSVDAAAKTLVLQAASYTTPAGKTVPLPRLKEKTVQVGATPRSQLGGRSGFEQATSSLGVGDFLVAIGKDLGAGKPLPARSLVKGLNPSEGPLVERRGFVFRPRFSLTEDRSVRGGTLFAAEAPSGRKVLLTAGHLLGPDGGLPAEVPPAEIGTAVLETALYDMAYSARLATGGKPLGQEVPEGDSREDLLALELPDGADLHTAPLAASLPTVGAPVWLIGCEVKDKATEPRSYLGFIRLTTAKRLYLRLVERPVLTGFSGAPVLNAWGEVVGMLVTGDAGMAGVVPAARILERLGLE